MGEIPGGAIGGVVAALPTPFRADLSPDLGELAHLCRWLLDHGCDGLSPIGSVGEGASLSLDERLALLEGLVAAGVPASRLVPETGCLAIPDTARLTRAAVGLGMAGAMLVAPFFYKGVSEAGLFDYFVRVVDGVGDERLRLYLFDFAGMTGVPLSSALIARLGERFPGVFVGIKGGGGDVASTAALVRALPRIAVYTGWEKLLLPVLKAGGAGALSATTNITAPLTARLYAAWRAGREADARALQERLAAVAEAITARGAYAAVKALIALGTQKPSWRLLRPPLSPLPEDEARALKRSIEAAGLRLPSWD